jgi:DNA ligase-associated metallophosphoesterase
MNVVRVNPLGAGRPAETEVVLLAERAVWWPSARTLLVADLHLGKCETLRVNGAPMPETVLRADLARLGAVVARTEASRVIVLGDLLHTAAGVTPWLVDVVGGWRERAAAGVEMAVVPGNHDTRIEAVAKEWGLAVWPDLAVEGVFAFCHEPCEREGVYTWAGHVHPLAAVRGSRDSLSLPCFWLGNGCGVLPAFSAFTGGVCVGRGAGERVFAVAEGRVLEI